MNIAPSTKSCLKEGYPVHWKWHLTGVYCPMHIDEETVAR